MVKKPKQEDNSEDGQAFEFNDKKPTDSMWYNSHLILGESTQLLLTKRIENIVGHLFAENEPPRSLKSPRLQGEGDQTFERKFASRSEREPASELPGPVHRPGRFVHGVGTAGHQGLPGGVRIVAHFTGSARRGQPTAR